MTTMKLLLLKTGGRLMIFKIRNLSFMLSLFSIFLFVATIGFSRNAVIARFNFYFAAAAICTMIIAIILSSALALPKKAGTLSIGEDIIVHELAGTEMKLDQLEILLNMDEMEFMEIKNSSSPLKFPTFGNYIKFNENKTTTNVCEVVISSQILVNLVLNMDSRIFLHPMFAHRSLLMTSPKQVIQKFYIWFIGWQ